MLYPILLILAAASFAAGRAVELGWNGGLNNTLPQPAVGQNGFTSTTTPTIPTIGSRQAEKGIPYEGIPFPKQDWHGLRTPNYTDLYLNYTEPVHCIRTAKPIGFYGYIDWLTTCIILALTLANTIQMSTPSPQTKLHHLSGLYYFSISITRAAKAYKACSKEVQIAGGSYVVEGDKITYAHNSLAFNFLSVPLIIQIILFIVQGLNLMTEDSWEDHACVWMIMTVINFLAFALTLFFSFLFYTGYTLFLYADSSMGPQIACIVLTILLLIISTFWFFRSKFGMSPADLWDGFGPFLILLIAIFVFHVLCVGISYTLLGRTIDDPWGKTSCTGPLGVLHAASDAFVLVFATIMSVFQEAGGV